MSKSIFDQPLGDPSGRHARGGFEYQDHIGASYCLQMLRSPELLEVWFESHDDITLLWDMGHGVKRYEFVQVKFVDKPWTLGVLVGRSKGEPGTSILEKSLAQNKYAEPCTFRLVTSRDACSELRSLRYPIISPERATAVTEIEAALTSIKRKYDTWEKPPSREQLALWLRNCVWEERESTIPGLEAINLRELDKVLAYLGLRLETEHKERLYDSLMRRISKASYTDTFASREVFKEKQLDLKEWVRATAHELVNGPNPDDRLGSKLEEAGIAPADIEAARELKRMYNAERRDGDFCEPSDLRAMERVVLGAVTSLQRKQYNPKTELPPLEYYDECFSTAIKQVYLRRFVDEDGASLIPDWVPQGYVCTVIDRCLLRFVNKT